METILDSLDVNNLPKPWTKRQFLFALAYLEDPKHEATAAAVKAGYSAKTAGEAASRLLASVNFKHIQAYIGARMKKVVDEMSINAERTLRHQAAMAYSNILDYLTFDAEGQPRFQLEDVARDRMAAISSLEITEMKMPGDEDSDDNRVVMKTKIQLWNKNKANEVLMKHLDLLKPDTIVSINTAPASIDETDKADIAKRVAFLLRQAAEGKKKQPKN